MPSEPVPLLSASKATRFSPNQTDTKRIFKKYCFGIKMAPGAKSNHTIGKHFLTALSNLKINSISNIWFSWINLANESMPAQTYHKIRLRTVWTRISRERESKQKKKEEKMLHCCGYMAKDSHRQIEICFRNKIKWKDVAGRNGQDWMRGWLRP